MHPAIIETDPLEALRDSFAGGASSDRVGSATLRRLLWEIFTGVSSHWIARERY